MPDEETLNRFYEASRKNLLKTYPKSDPDIASLLAHAKNKPLEGTPIPTFNGFLFKMRGEHKAYKEGKRGGLRLIYAFDGNRVYDIYIYSKKKQENHPLEVLKEWVKEYVASKQKEQQVLK